MPRSIAAVTIAPVLGPRRSSSSISRSVLIIACASGSSAAGSLLVGICHALSTKVCAISTAAKATVSSLYSTTTIYKPGCSVGMVPLKLTGQPACVCKASSVASSACASVRGP